MHSAPIQPEPPLRSTRAAPTFADALAAIATWTDIDEQRRRDLASALRSAARMLSLPPATIPAEPGWLNERLFQHTPATFGISQGRYRNIISGVRAVRRRLGAHTPDGRTHADRPAAWRALLASVPRASQRGALAAFARHCAAAGFAPERVTDTALAEFVAAEASQRLSAATVRGRARQIAAAWNACVRATLPGWPVQLLAAARERRLSGRDAPADGQPPRPGGRGPRWRSRPRQKRT